MKRLLVFALAFLLILPSSVRAQTEVEDAVKYILTVIFGLPGEWKVGDYIWYGLIPFLGVWLIIFGFLTVIRIFGRDRNKLYGALSFFIAFSTLPLGWFAFFVTGVFQAMGVWSTVIFFIMFIIGTVFAFIRGVYRGYKKVGIEKRELGRLDSQLASINKSLKNEYKKLSTQSHLLQ